MTGAAHRRRGGNNTGYVRVSRLSSGEARYEARLRNKWLGAFETRAKAEYAIKQARAKLGIGNHTPTEDDVA